MNEASPEAQFFHDISRKVLDYVSNYDKTPSISISKREGDYATEIDLAVEEMIVAEIKLRFPNDEIMAEEGHSETNIGDTRLWIIDPICGTTNLRRGISTFCTNIALAVNSKLIASCVVDYSQGEYFWSVGQNKVYINDALFVAQKAEEKLGHVVDVNLGTLGGMNREERRTHAVFINKLLSETDYFQLSLGSSLSFTYTAVGKIDGFISATDNAWDIAAASFLIEQAGGTITQANGDPWVLQRTTSSIASLSSDVHEKLVACAQKAGY